MNQARTPAGVVRLLVPPPRWIAAYALPPDLSRWLGEVLRQRWPHLRWDSTTDVDALQRWQVDLWLVDALPQPSPAAPTLWLTGPERHTRLTRASRWIWELPAPILGPNLVDAVHAVHASFEWARR